MAALLVSVMALYFATNIGANKYLNTLKCKMYHLVHGQMPSFTTGLVSSANSKSTRRLMQNTPAPTAPEDITCTEQDYVVSGDYNDEKLSFYIQVTYSSFMTIDARDSTADNAKDTNLIGLEFEFPDGTVVTDGDGMSQYPDQYANDILLLGVGDLEKGDYRLDYFMGFPQPADMFGTFVLSIRCDAIPTSSPTSAAPTDPTAAPTDPTAAPTDPTAAPTDPTAAPTNPTAAPTNPTAAPTNPTAAPTDPTAAPTDPTAAPTDPTAAPTDTTAAPTNPTPLPTPQPTSGPSDLPSTSSPTIAPTAKTSHPTSDPTPDPTPAPTNPANITCSNEGSFVRGEYNDEVVSFYIAVTQYSNITIDARNSTAENVNDIPLISLELTLPNGDTVVDDDNDPDTLSDQYPDDVLLLGASDLEKGNYRLRFFIGYPPPLNKYGTFVMSIRCDAFTTTLPTPEPTPWPTAYPTDRPTKFPSTIAPTPMTSGPTSDPTVYLTVYSTIDPTINPTMEPTQEPTRELTFDPTEKPTSHPTKKPTADTTLEPTTQPTFEPTFEPTTEPTTEPTIEPTIRPTIEPTTTIDLDSGTNRTVTFGSILTIGMTIFFAVSVLLCICGLSSRYFIGQKRIHQKPEYLTVDVPAKVVAPPVPDGKTTSYDIGERLQSFGQKSVDTPNFTEYPLALKKGRTDLKVSVSNIGNSPNQIERGYSTMRKSPGIAGRLKEWANVGQSSRNQYASVSTSDDGDSGETTLPSGNTCTSQTSYDIGDRLQSWEQKSVDTPSVTKEKSNLKVSVSNIGKSPTVIQRGYTKETLQTSQTSYDIGARLQSFGQKSVDTPNHIEKINANIGTSDLKSSVKTGATAESIDELSPSVSTSDAGDSVEKTVPSGSTCTSQTSYDIGDRLQSWGQKSVDTPAARREKSNLKVSMSNIGNSPTVIQRGYSKQTVQTSQTSYDIGARLQSFGQKSVDTPNHIEKINSNIGTSHFKSSVKRIDELSPTDIGNSPMTCLLQPNVKMDTTRTANNISVNNIGDSPTSPLCMVESIPDTEDTMK